MFYIYLYSDKIFKRNVMQYGYWNGKHYVHRKEFYPISSLETKGKPYSSMKRAISGGWTAVEKFNYVTGFDVEDEKGNVLFSSYTNKIMKNVLAEKEYEKQYKKQIQPISESKPEEKKEFLCQLIEIGMNVELKMSLNGICFYTHRKFKTEEEATEFAKEKGFKIV